jgi:hypothetical protein
MGRSVQSFDRRENISYSGALLSLYSRKRSLEKERRHSISRCEVFVQKLHVAGIFDDFEQRRRTTCVDRVQVLNEINTCGFCGDVLNRSTYIVVLCVTFEQKRTFHCEELKIKSASSS